jgi:ferredoxin-type protein NapF
LQLADRQPWSLRAVIDADACVAGRGVECRSCVDPCEQRAICMRLQVGGAAIPEVNISNCNGCGACFAVCPVQAIRMQPVE